MDSSESFLGSTKVPMHVGTREITAGTSLASTGIGKPCSKRLLTISDYLSAILTIFCFAIAISSVQSRRIAAYLGVQNQLVVLGFLLAVMAFVTFKQAQMLLIALEARFGGSILQNYDAIIRDDKFGSHVSPLIRFALIILYILPLSLSAAYKSFSNGGTTTVVDHTLDNLQLTFGPSGPPGLYLGNGISGYVNATSPLYNPQPSVAPAVPPVFPSSHGFTMHVINATHTVMLDTPLSSELDYLQASLHEGEVKRLSARVNATYASLNSTISSPERADFDAYWSNIKYQMGTSPQFSVSRGGGSWFGMWNGGIDMSLVFLSVFNESSNQTFESQANGFNIYRGSCQGTWTIAASGIFLEDAGDFATSWSPKTPHPALFGGGVSDCDPGSTADPSQALITCFWNPLAFKYYPVAAEYLGVSPETTQGTVEEDGFSYWVASVAAMAWSSLAVNTRTAEPNGTGDSGLTQPHVQLSEKYPYIAYESPYSMTSTVITMRRGFGLCAVLSIQPLLLLAILVARCLLHEVPISENFGITTLLAGASRGSLDVLGGAAFSGELKRKVRVQILVHDPDPETKGVQNIEYLFDGLESNSRLRRRKLEHRQHTLFA